MPVIVIVPRAPTRIRIVPSRAHTRARTPRLVRNLYSRSHRSVLPPVDRLQPAKESLIQAVNAIELIPFSDPPPCHCPL